MATLAAIRTALKTVLEADTVGLKVYPLIPGSPTPRCVVIRPADADYTVAMRKGLDTWTLDLTILLSGSDLAVAQTHLDGYIDGGGPNSLRSIIFATNGLGLADTDAHIAGMTGYGTHPAAAYEHIGAVLRLVVHTKPTA